MMNKNNYPYFPHPDQNKDDKLIFNKQKFISLNQKNETFELLEYSTSDKGWNDKLNKIFEEEVNINHPIDVASRELCIKLLNKFDTSKKKIVLEIGCSNGRLIKHITKNKQYKYIGSDALKENILFLSKKNKDIPFLVFDLLKNPFNESICDSLIMLNVLEHIDDDQKALKEVSNLLNKNGILILEVPAVKYLYDSYDKNLLHYRRYNMKELLDKIEKAGFKIVYKTHLGFLTFPFFFVIKFINKIFKREQNISKQAKFSDNFILKILFSLEKKLNGIYLPIGIRCYVCAIKI